MERANKVCRNMETWRLICCGHSLQGSSQVKQGGGTKVRKGLKGEKDNNVMSRVQGWLTININAKQIITTHGKRSTVQYLLIRMISTVINICYLTCHTDIWRTVLRLSRLLLQRRVMSDRNNFFTSIKLSDGLLCRIKVAQTFRITAKREQIIDIKILKIIYSYLLHLLKVPVLNKSKHIRQHCLKFSINAYVAYLHILT